MDHYSSSMSIILLNFANLLTVFKYLICIAESDERMSDACLINFEQFKSALADISLPSAILLSLAAIDKLKEVSSL